jgi:hypothetical protein
LINLILSEKHPQRKTFFEADGKIQASPIRMGAYWASKSSGVSSLKTLYETLLGFQKKENLSHLAVMRGDWLPGEELWKIEAERKEKLKAGEEDARLKVPVIYRDDQKPKLAPRKLRRRALMIDNPLHWVCFDFDSVEFEGANFDLANPFSAMDAIIKSELGEEFVDVKYILQFSSSAGIKPGIRAHAWFWLKNAFNHAHWEAWYKARERVLGRKPHIDKGMFQPERIHYIAPPVFKKADLDPLKGKSRWLMSGGKKDSVTLAVPEIVEAAQGEDRDYFDLGDSPEDRQDAFSRPGIVGVFNRCFSMSDTIQTFLHDHYKIDDSSGRVSWLASEQGGGCKIFAGNTKMYSSHNNDPLGGNPGNAFDHIQYVLFDGDFASAANWAESLPKCIAEKERAASAEFDDSDVDVSFESKIDPEKKNEEKIVVLTPEIVMETYPMPEKWMGQKAMYRKTTSGWKYGYMEEDEDSGRTKFVELWSPVTVWSRDICVETKTVSFVIRIMNEKEKPLDITIHRGEAVSKTILSHLWGVGWACTNANGEKFVDFLRSRGDAASTTRYVAPQRGWFEVEDRAGVKTNAFAAPSGEIIASESVSKSLIGLRSDWIVQHAKAGTFTEWKGAVDDLCKIENVPHWILGVAAGFTGPLMHLFGGNTVGVAICGRTSRGKSTALGWAASVWTTPEERFGGLMRSLKATANAIENLAAGANGTVLLLDETNLMDGRQLESAVYSIASGSGKQRLKVDGTLRPNTNHWSTFALLTGEAKLAQRFESKSGQKMGQGAAVRLLDFDVSEVNGAVPNETIQKLQIKTRHNYGWAGEMFVNCLIENGFVDDPKMLWQMRKDAIESIAGEAPVGVAARTAEILSIMKVGVRLAITWGILPDSFGPRFDAAIKSAWGQVLYGAVMDSQNEILDQIHGWVNSKWDRSIVDVDSSDGVRDIEAWYDSEFIYIPPGRLLEATGNIVQDAEIKKVLRETGYLKVQEEKTQIRFVHKYIPKVGAQTHLRLFRGRFKETGAGRDEGLKPEDLF